MKRQKGMTCKVTVDVFVQCDARLASKIEAGQAVEDIASELQKMAVSRPEMSVSIGEIKESSRSVADAPDEAPHEIAEKLAS